MVMVCASAPAPHPLALVHDAKPARINCRRIRQAVAGRYLLDRQLGKGTYVLRDGEGPQELAVHNAWREQHQNAVTS